MAEKMKIELGAEIKEFQTKLEKAIKGLDKLKQEEKSLKKEFDKGAISADKYYKQLAENSVQSRKLSANTNKLKSSLAGLDKNMSKTAKETANGSSAMLAFSRTVQDAPFGLLGISNNITNLTEQFGALKNRTGSAGGALKLMLRDLRGFGGITFGISVATSLLLAFGDKLFKVKSRVSEFTKELENVSTKSIIEFKTLTSVLTDTTSSQREQAKAVSLLKEKYSDFDTSILTTKGNYEKSKVAIDNYVASLVRQAKSQAAMSIIEKKYAKIIQLEAKKSIKMRNSFGAATEEQFEKRRKKNLAIAEKTFKDSKDRLSKEGELNERSLKLLKESHEKNKKRINDKFNAVKNAGSKEIDVLKRDIATLTALANIKDLILFGDKGNTPTKDPVKIPYVLERVVKNNELEVPKLIDIDEIGVEPEPFDWDNYYNLKAAEEKQLEVKERLLKFQSDVNNLLSSAQTDTVSNIGESIGSALAGGNNVLKAAGNSMLSTLGGVLVKYGKLAIAFGVASEGVSQVFKNPFGGGIAAIIGGAALVAVGSAIKGFSSNVASGGNGGNISTNAGGRDFSSGTSFNSNVKEESNEGMQLVLKGEDLYGSVDTFRRRRSNMGTNLNLG